MPRIAYFGPPGTFTEQAGRALARAGDELVPAETIPAALAAARTGAADAACVPVENSVEGAVFATLDALAVDEPLVTVAELVLPVRFSVLVRPGTTDVRTIASHPHALAQVTGWLAEHLPGARTVAATSTAAAAVAVGRGEFDAAVCAPVAVEHYALAELATDVVDVPDARTRFLLVRRPGVLPEPTGNDRTSLLAVTEDRVGALSELLIELSLRGINLSRIESRPTKGRLGEYRFYMDFSGHVHEPRIGDALAALHRRCRHLRFLGSYPTSEGWPPTEQPSLTPHLSGVSADDYAAAGAWLAAVRSGEHA